MAGWIDIRCMVFIACVDVYWTDKNNMDGNLLGCTCISKLLKTKDINNLDFKLCGNNK